VALDTVSTHLLRSIDIEIARLTLHVVERRAVLRESAMPNGASVLWYAFTTVCDCLADSRPPRRGSPPR